MDVEEGPVSQLNAQTPAIVKSIVKQLTAKNLATRQAGFVLLHELIAVLDGGLETQIPALVTRIETSLQTSDSGLSGAATALKIEVLSFLARFFRTHHLKTFSDELPRLVPLVATSISDRFNKIASEAFITASELIKVLRPVSRTAGTVSSLSPASVSHLSTLFTATMGKLTGSDADEDVKGKGIQTLGTLLFHAGDQAASDLEAALAFLRDRLRNEVQRVISVRTVGLVASSPVLKSGDSVAAVDAWAASCLPEVSTLLRKVHRPLKVAAFEALDALLERSTGQDVPAATVKSILGDLVPLLGSADSEADVNLIPHALTTLTTLLTVDPSTSSKPIEKTALPRVLEELVTSPLVQGPSLDALLHFFAAAVKAGIDAASLIEKLGQAAVSGAEDEVHAAATASRCVGVVVREAPDQAEAVIKDSGKVVKVRFLFLLFLLASLECTTLTPPSLPPLSPLAVLQVLPRPAPPRPPHSR
jgi:cullin-associated NEDD8-dissociated protein 1